MFTSSDSPLLQAVSPLGGDASVFLAGDESIEVFTGIQEFDDGEHVLTRVLAASDSGSPSRFYLAKFDGMRATRVREIPSLRTPAGVAQSVYPSGDRYLIVEDGEVFVADADPKTKEIVGDPAPLISGRRVSRISVGRTGRLVYSNIRGRLDNELLLLDRGGNTLRSLGPRADGIGFDYFGARFSRDGQSVFYEYHSGKGTGDLYRVQTRDGRIVRQTLDESHHNAFVAVAPDGRVVFTSTREGGDLFVKVPDGAPEQRIPLPTDVGFPYDWSPDGRWILYSNTGIGGDVWRTTPTGDSIGPVLNSPAAELHAAFSADGKWLAYASDQQGGRFEISLRRWPLTNEQWVVSTAGGEAPRWRGDGRELFFLRRTPGSVRTTVMVVPLDLSGATPIIGRDSVLFTTRFRSGERNLRSSVNYDVSSDGQRVVGPVLEDDVQNGPALMHLLVNWPAALRQRSSPTPR